MKAIFVALGMVFSTAAFAVAAQSGRWDYAYSLGLRSQPTGLSVWGELGYSHLLWGTPQKGNPFYGYLRPKISLQTSAVVNRGDIGVDFAFWAPLVLELSYGLDHRNTDFAVFDCASLECRGLLLRTRAALKSTLGFGTYFLLWDAIWENVQASKNPAVDFGDEAWSLRGEHPSDSILSTDLTIGKKVNEVWSAGITGTRSIFLKSEENSNLGLVFVSYQQAPLRYFFGVGIYESSRVARGFTTSFGVRWVGGDSFSLR